MKKVGDRNYVVSTPDHRKPTQLCHVNLLKKYHERSTAEAVCSVVSTKQSSPVVSAVVEQSTELDCRGPVSARLQNSAALADLDSLL